MKTYTAEEARPLILNGSLKDEYAVIGSLDFSGYDLTNVTLPSKMEGWLSLSGCDLTGITIPSKVTMLDLSDCDLTGIALPAKVDGSLDLRGCDLTGVTLPTKVSRSLLLRRCTNPDPSQWWREQGQSVKRHCLAISFYALIEREDGLYSAGCHGPWTAKEALARWSLRKDQRAKIFTATIKANEERKSK